MFKVDPSLEVTVWASTPFLFNPTNMDIDHAGRIWVAEGVNYRGRNGTRPDGDRIAVLQDTDGDGKCDSSHTFVQETGLIAPLGVAVFDNVVYLSPPPALLAYTDIDRDLKFDPAVDKREVILTGFNAINHDHGLHSLVSGPDGKFHFNNSNLSLKNALPLVIQSAGGITQLVPKDRIEKKNEFQRSLMYDPAALGLKAQDIADIAAFLESYR